MRGGLGNDALLGGSGRDTFIFARGDGEDTIYDFTSGKDHIAFEHDSFGFAADATASDVVQIGGATPTAGRWIYIAGGDVTFDPNWSTAAGREVLAHVEPDTPSLGDVALI